MKYCKQYEIKFIPTYTKYISLMPIGINFIGKSCDFDTKSQLFPNADEYFGYAKASALANQQTLPSLSVSHFSREPTVIYENLYVLRPHHAKTHPL